MSETIFIFAETLVFIFSLICFCYITRYFANQKLLSHNNKEQQVSEEVLKNTADQEQNN